MAGRTGRSPEEEALLQKAMRVLPGGGLGGYCAPQELALVVREARGPRLCGFSGRDYIDYILDSGPHVLGHAHPAVVAAVEGQLRKGTTYFQLSEPTLALAEEICRAVPCAEQVRFCSTGSEATFFALRVARAFRKRDKILKFEGGFHGVHDYSLMSVGPREPKALPAPTPDSAGIPHAIQGEVLIAPFNDLVHRRLSPWRIARTMRRSSGTAVRSRAGAGWG
jgi:glutamate-1-semialdehyde 2,1-aminomutase